MSDLLMHLDIDQLMSWGRSAHILFLPNDPPPAFSEPPSEYGLAAVF